MADFLPSKDDQEEIYNDLVPPIYREIFKYLLCHVPSNSGVQHHIPHLHSICNLGNKIIQLATIEYQATCT